jgi:hypothetical protein
MTETRTENRTGERWVVECMRHQTQWWTQCDAFSTLEEARSYIDSLEAPKTSFDVYRIVHRVTVLTVTETVIK